MTVFLLILWLSGALVNTYAFIITLRDAENDLKEFSHSMVTCAFIIGFVCSWLIPLYFICEKLYYKYFGKEDDHDEEGAAE